MGLIPTLDPDGQTHLTNAAFIADVRIRLQSILPVLHGLEGFLLFTTARVIAAYTEAGKQQADLSQRAGARLLLKYLEASQALIAAIDTQCWIAPRGFHIPGEGKMQSDHFDRELNSFVSTLRHSVHPDRKRLALNEMGYVLTIAATKLKAFTGSSQWLLIADLASLASGMNTA